MAKSGPTPFGYRRDGEKLILDSAEAPIRKKMFELFFKHQRKKIVAEILNAENFKTRNGADFSSQTVGRLLIDKIVIGDNGEIEALISKELFEQCQIILKSQAKKGGAKRLPRHPFSGLTFCHCGGKMYVPSGSQKYVCRSCKAKISTNDLETIFVETVIAELKKEDQQDLLKPFNQWPILSLRSKIGLTQLTAARIDVNLKQNNVTITLIPYTQA